MSPEYNFHLKISASGIEEASALREFLLRVRGVEEIAPIDQFRVALAQKRVASQAFIDLATPLGQVVRAWREERGMKLTDLAKQAGRPITKGYISSLEHGKIKQPGDTHLVHLASTLGISVEDILLRRMPPKEK